MKERRKFVRLNTSVSIVYTRRHSLGKEKLSLSSNIGEGGICFTVYEKLRKSDLLDLKIYLREDEVPIEVIGRVIWIKEFIINGTPKGRKFNAGIEFVKINEEGRKQIEKYIRSAIR